MSIASKKKKQSPDLSPPEGGSHAPPSRRKRRRLTISAVVVAAVAIVVGLLPTIIAHTPLMAYFVRRAAMLDGSIAFRSASIGWFSSASVSGITICDAQNETVLEADSLTCNRSLIRLVFNSSNIGTLRLEKPRLNVKCTRDGSNLESLVARWLTGPSGSSKGVDLSVEIVDGEATVVDQETQRSWHVTDLQVALDMSRRLPWPTRVEGTATIDDRGHPCGLSWKSHVKASDAPPAEPAAWCGLAGTDGDLSLQITALPLAMYQPLAARGSPGLKLDGTLVANIEAQWAGPADVKVNGTLGGNDLSIESSALGRDVLHLEKVQAAWKTARQDKRLTVEEARLDCDVGNLAAKGHVDLGEHGLEAWADPRQPDCSVQGALDLARLARLLPGTLRIRPGTEITSGQVQLTVGTTNSAAVSLPEPPKGGTTSGGMAWQARLQTSQLTAVDRGRQISWDKPVSIDAVLHQAEQGLVVDSLACQSDFLQVTGSGTPDRLTLSTTLDLRRLSEELGRFVDLGGLALSGDGKGGLQWSRTATGDFDAQAQFELHNFQLALPQRPTVAEESLSISLAPRATPTSPRRGSTRPRCSFAPPAISSTFASCSRSPN